jgi:hypothetical protein
MYRSSANRLFATLASAVVCLFLFSVSADGATRTPQVVQPKKHDRSGPLRDATPPNEAPSGPNRIAARNEGPTLKAPGVHGVDPVVQRRFGTSAPTPLADFDGATAADNEPFYGFTLAPPDTEGDVGNGYYFQFVNSVFMIFETGGTNFGAPVLGPLPGNAIFEGFGGLCENFHVTDPIVRYDELAGRFLVTYLAFDINVQDTFDMCIAVSQTGDPTGSYNRYSYNFGNVPDYPKFGVWPDGYYMTVNQFDLPFFNYAGIATWVFDRTAMLAGDPALAIGFTDLGLDMFSMMPADLDGSMPPGAGAPNPQVTLGHPVWDLNPDPVWHFFYFHADFATPGNSTLTGPVDLPIPDLNPDLCGFSRNCIPQLDSADGLDPLPGRPMNGMQYRNFGDHESLVISQTVNVAPTASEGGSGNQAGVRWYEVRTPDSPTLYQSGTYAPDSTNRFMPSIAMDINGNIAVGYSVSDASIYPEIRLTGRLSTDPLGEMGAEDTMFAGTGSQIATLNRWGDYSAMVVDPADGCTFWYTNQYYETTGQFDWKTRIGSFKFASCTIGDTGTLEGTVTDGANPIQGATVTAGVSSTTTNSAGFYSFTLPVGTYDMTASKFGYLPAAADDVQVNVGETTVQDFTLAAAPSTLVNGTVRDAQGGWPLYARIQVSGPGYPGATLWTDPVTGYYQVMLVDGITYTFVITAVSPGYLPGGGDVALNVPLAHVPALVQNWTLTADPVTCNAPGYTGSGEEILFEDFSGGVIPPGWTVVNNSSGGDGVHPTEWVVEDGGEPCNNYPGNQTGGTGFFAVSDSDCPGPTTAMDTSLITPSLDLSSVASPVLQFKQDYVALGDVAAVDVSIDGGSNWTSVLSQTSTVEGPNTQELSLPMAANQGDVMVRFRNYNAFYAWWWQVDDITINSASCTAGTGGLVVGTVTDAANGNGLNGATVTNLGGDSTTTFPTPDPAQGDGFYILYAEAGPQDFEASLNLYQPDQASALIVPGSTQRLDFVLESGNLSVDPNELNGRTDPGGTDSEDVTVTNTGAAPASFEFVEINAPLLASETHGFADERLRQRAIARLPQGGKGHTALSSRGLSPLAGLPDAMDRVLAAGDVISSFDSGLAIGWGVATAGSDIWISNPSYIGAGDNNDHRFLPDGTDTGDVISDEGVGLWAGDGAFNALTGKFWHVAVGGDNCLYEFDPATLSQTGNTICGSPWTGISQRGLAYDQGNDAFFVGGWNELTVYHIDLDGNVIDSAFVNLPISGMAYSSANGHLLVMSNQPAGQDIEVLDTLDNYNSLGGFQVMDGGSPAFGDFEQAGMEFDCVGNLWAINQATQVVYQIESGEAAGCEVDIPWFAIVPDTGVVGPNGGTAVSEAQWDAGSLLPGLQLAQLVVKTDTPHQIPNIPVSLTVRFLDVPDSNQFEAYIYGVAGAGIMMGGPPNCPSGILYFCPDNPVTRADMAGYLWRAVNGRNTPPPVYQNIFEDVTFNDYNAFYIQGIFELGITAGCSAQPPLYCPDADVTRAQMSAFIWRAEHGDVPPPACTPGVFADVPCPSLFADYIEGLFNEGVTAGCGGGNFCPNANITNGQMATFIGKAFHIPVLLP